jgi:hypothetical protein
MKPGDKITVRFRVSGPNAINKLPELSATVLSVEGDLVRFRYADGAELYAGLIGQARLPRIGKPWVISGRGGRDRRAGEQAGVRSKAPPRDEPLRDVAASRN